MFAVQAATDNTTHLKNTEILVEKNSSGTGCRRNDTGCDQASFLEYDRKKSTGILCLPE